MISRREFNTTLLASSMASPAFARANGSDTKTDTATFDSELFSIEGRVAKRPDGSCRAGFPGVVIRSRFKGSRFILHSAASTDTQWIDVVVDGGEPKTVHLEAEGQGTVLFDGSSGIHAIEIARRNESWQGVWDLISAHVPDGRFLPPAPLPSRKLLFIGDSVTSAEASDVDREDTRLDIGTADAQRSYGKLIARALDAQCHLVSYGGRGLIRDWQGRRDTRNAPQFYPLAAPDDPSAPWDAKDYIPEAIGVMLGTNDFSSGVPDRAEFTNAFVDFIRTIHGDAPAAAIFLLDSPILDDQGGAPKKTILRDCLEDVVRRCPSPLVSHVPIGHYAGRSVNAHPIAADHVSIAAEVEPAFRRALELAAVPTPSISSS